MPSLMQPHSAGRFRLPADSEKDARLTGNRLRRALLDESTGMAVTAARIEGAPHEYQAVPGVREDALLIIQNLKKIRIRSEADFARATLDSTGPRVTARDIIMDSGEATDPDLILANLTPGAKLRMEIIFERGSGIGTPREVPEGFIPIEAAFPPVGRVAVKPLPDAVEIEVRTDGSISPEAALGEAMQRTGDVREYVSVPVEPPRTPGEVRLAPGLDEDPFGGFAPPSILRLSADSYQEFLSGGLSKLFDQLFPLTGRTLDSGDEPAETDERRLDLIDWRIGAPLSTPDQCIREGTTFEAPLVLRVRVRRSERDCVFGADDPRAVTEEEVDMGSLPLMAEDSGFVINGSPRACVMILEEGLRVRRVGDLLTRELEALVSRLKPILEDRVNVTGWLTAEVVKLLPLVSTAADLLASADWCQYMDETNPLASLTHKLRTGAKALLAGKPGDEVRALTPGHYGRLGYLETPEGPNIGLVHSLCPYVRLGDNGEILTPYRKVEDCVVSEEIAYLTAQDEAGFRIADASALGADGRISGGLVSVRQGDDIRRVPPGEVELVSLSPVQAQSYSSALIPFLGHNDPTRALMGANMQRQAVPLIEAEQPLVKTGLEARAARESGQMLVAWRAGKVAEVTGERIVVFSSGKRDIYPLTRFRRSNQATCIDYRPAVEPGQEVTEGQVLADMPSSRGGEIALGRNVLAAYMPFRGLNFEDAICISDELLASDTFTSISLEKAEVEVGDAEVWSAPVGARVSPGDVLVQESTGRKRALLVAPGYGPTVVVGCLRTRGRIRVMLAERRTLRIGDKMAGRHGNKGVVARVLPRSQMPYLEDGAPVQVVLNTLGVFSRLNVGQVLETHYGALAHALGRPVVVPQFATPPHDELRRMLREAGLSETGMETLYDGATGRPFESPVTVGRIYLMKLAHMVEDKLHATSTSLPSLVTHQPMGWRSGGQRLGFLEMWALEAYNAGRTLQEFLTIKSDDAQGREKAALALLAGEEVEPAGEGLSLQLLEGALRGLGISVEEER